MTDVPSRTSTAFILRILVPLVVSGFLVIHQIKHVFKPAIERKHMSIQHQKWLHPRAKYAPSREHSVVSSLPIPLDLMPLDIGNVYNLTRKNEKSGYYHSHSFNRPMVIATYARTPGTDANFTDIFFFLTGVSMTYLQRNLSVAGCVIGHDVVEAQFFFADVVQCRVWRQLEEGERLTVVLLKDSTLIDVLHGPVELKLGFYGIIEDGDVTGLEGNSILHGRLKALNASDLMSVRSLEYFRGFMDVFNVSASSSLPRYQLCLMTQIAPYTEYLRGWIDYHRRLGIDQVYLFDNHVQEDLSQKFKSRPDITVVYWPWARSQTQAFTYFQIMSRPRCEWVLFCDVDEYVMLGLGKGMEFSRPGSRRPLVEYVKGLRRRGHKQITFPSITMRNSGYKHRVLQPIPEAYIHRSSEQNFPKAKSMCESDHDWVASYIWTCASRDEFISPSNYKAMSQQELSIRLQKNEKERAYFPDKPGLFPNTSEDPAILVHFKQLSWQDEIIKRESPRNNLNSDRKNATNAKLWHIESPPRSFLATNGFDKVKYTHFQKIYRRVTSTLSITEQTIVQIRNGKRCETTFAFSKQVEKIEEICEH